MRQKSVVRNGIRVFLPICEFKEEDRTLIEAVANKKKVACSVIATEEAFNLAESLSLVVRRSWNAIHQFPDTSFSTWAISRRETCRDAGLLEVLSPHFSDLPDIEQRARSILLDIQDWYIADALVLCGSYPRIDGLGKPISESNIERPEISLLQGLLFGYNPCCVREVVGICHTGEEANFERVSTLLRGILCRECSTKAV